MNPITGLILGLLAFQAKPEDPIPVRAVADIFTLDDGTTLLGQGGEPGRQGVRIVVARRAWVEANQPERAKGWASLEANETRIARLERRDRLFQWQRDRQSGGGGNDAIGPWIRRQISAVADSSPPRTPLMWVFLRQNEVRGVRRAAERSGRLLRNGWLAAVAEPEVHTPEVLTAELNSRNELLPEDDPASINRLLPLRPESERIWRIRRAATEALNDPQLRFVQFRQLIIPEDGPRRDMTKPGSQTDLLDLTSARAAFGAIQAVPAAGDPVQNRLDEEGRRGRIGAIVSRIELRSGLGSATAESALWYRQENGAWTSAFSRRATLGANEPLEPDEPVAASTPIRSTLMILESVSAMPAEPGVSRRRQVDATAAQRALGRARAALDRDLEPYLLTP